MSKHILLIGGTASLNMALAEQIDGEPELDAETVDSGEAALIKVGAKVGDNQYDGLVLDDTLPDMAGHELCRMLRQTGLTIPIIALTTGTDKTMLGEETGASDCLTKPVRMTVLLERLHRQLCSYEHNKSMAVGPYVFQSADNRLVHPDGTIHLTEKEAAILRFLHQAKGQVVTRRKLLTEVWGYGRNVATRTLEAHVYQLRKKIKDRGQKIIVSAQGGYRLGAPAMPTTKP